MHRNIAFPLDGELCDKARKRLLKLARKVGIRPRRTYAKLSPWVRSAAVSASVAIYGPQRAPHAPPA